MSLTKPLMKSFCEKILRADPSFIENTGILPVIVVVTQAHSRVNPLFSKQIVLPLLLLFLLFILPYFLKRVINGLKKENSTLCGIIKNVVQAGCISSRLGMNQVRCYSVFLGDIFKMDLFCEKTRLNIFEHFGAESSEEILAYLQRTTFSAK